jgi:ribosomal protein L40E
MQIFCSQCGTEQNPYATQCHECGATILRPEHQPKEPARNKAGYRWKNIAMAAAGGLYLVYPSLGLFELIPDAIPVVGSLDEATATAGLLYALSNLGWIPWQRRE